MSEPFCMVASDIDNLTIAQLLLYFTNEEDVKGNKTISQEKMKEIIKKNNSEVMTREEFLKRGEEIRKKKLAAMQARRQDKIAQAKKSNRMKV